jgi:hypothetical protein
MEGVTIERARAAKTHILDHVADLPQVNGVGLARLGEGYAVKVNLSEPLENGKAIPQEWDGVPVVVDLVGRIVAR